MVWVWLQQVLEIFGEIPLKLHAKGFSHQGQIPDDFTVVVYRHSCQNSLVN